MARRLVPLRAAPGTRPTSGRGRPARAIDLIVVHSISLPPGEYGGDEVQQLFTNTLDWDAHPYFRTIEGMQVSAHFFIRRDGELWQFVSCDDRAWHAGASQLARPRQLQRRLDRHRARRPGRRARSKPAQYETLAGLCAAIAQRYPVAHVAGHEHIAPGRKTDPGRGLRLAAVAAQPGLAGDVSDAARMFPPRTRERSRGCAQQSLQARGTCTATTSAARTRQPIALQPA